MSLSSFLELLADNQSVPGRLVTSAIVIFFGVVLAFTAGRLISRRFDDSYSRHYSRKASGMSLL